jgi:hypothetical protein
MRSLSIKACGLSLYLCSNSGQPPMLSISSPDGATTWGIPDSLAARSRSFSAVQLPPRSSPPIPRLTCL